MISGVQDLHNSVGSLESRLAESISDMQKQLNQTVNIPEFKQLRKQMETFVTAEHLAEELKSKANKASVANALSRKANK
jgi:anaerobic glycerol-3-phosphate dehydrogenase